jgi:hypothetical protein
VAVLDREFALRAGRMPQVTTVLLKRITRTANWLLAKCLVAGAVRDARPCRWHSTCSSRMVRCAAPLTARGCSSKPTRPR